MTLRKGGLVVISGILTSAALEPCPTLGATIRDDQPDSGYLELAARPEYAAVGTFVNSWGYTGSGTLIASDWVLTAAHNLVLATSGTFTLNGTPYTGTELFLNPNWHNGNPFGGYDFGLVHLNSPVTDVSPALLYPGSSEFGVTATYVGYGFTGTGLTGYQTLDHQKRAFQNVVDGSFGNPEVLLGSDFDNPHTTADNSFGDPIPLALEGCVVFGDSGGGVFIADGSQTYLAGVISFVAATDGSANGDYGDVSGFGRVSAITPWIISTIPEPSPLLLLGVAGPVMFFARRWR